MAINLNHPTNTIDGTSVLNVNSGDGENIELNPDSGLVNVNGNINIAGNFTVQGTTTTVNSTTSSIVDPIILLGTDEDGNPAATVDSKDRGVAFYYNDGLGNKTGFFGYDRGTGYFRFVPDAVISGEIVSGSDGTIKIDTLESTTNNTVDLNVSNDANITGDLTVGGHVIVPTTEIGDLNFSSNTISSDTSEDIVLDPGSNDIDVSNSVIKNLSDPVNLQDAATKNYVDTAINDNTNLDVAADTGTGTINLATETLTINGTNFQVETSVVGNVITITLPTNMTVPGSLNITTDLTVTNNAGIGGTLTTTGNATFQSDVTVQGSLNVLGTLTSINTVDTEIKDNYITLNQGETGDGVSAGFSGFEIDRGAAVDGNALLQWNENIDFWEFGVGTSYANLAAYNLYLAGSATIDGAVNMGSLEVGDLTEGRVVYVGTGGELVDSNQLTFTGTGLHIEKNLYVDSGNNIIASGNADVTGEVTAANVTVTTLTEDRIPFANQDSRLIDSPSLTFDVVTALLSVPNISASNEISAGTIKDANLTTGRVVFSGSGGELIDNFYFTFDNSSTALNVDDITIDNGSIVFGNAANITASDGNITLDAGANNVSVSSSRIINVADPVNPQDAATKTWVETIIDNNANLSIAGTNGSGTVNLATETFTVAGTANQIATLAAGQGVTVSLPNAVTMPGSLAVTSTLDVTGHTNVSTIIASGAATLDSLSVTNDLDVLGSTIIYGNLTVQGTTTSVQSVDTIISDNIITLNDGEAGAGVSSGYSGILVDRGTEPDTVFQWNELLDRWEIKEGTDLTYFAAAGVDAGDLNISGNTITSTQPNGDVVINSTGTGQVIVNGEPVVTGLDSIVYAIVFGG